MTGWKSKLNEAQKNDKDKKLLAYLSRQEDRVDPLMAPTTTTTKMLICSGWETAVVPVSQPGTPVRDKGGALLSRVWQPGQKRTFCPGW